MVRRIARRLITALAIVLGMRLGLAADVPAETHPLGYLRFSPDGRFVLAQDIARITVLTARPLAVLFQIAGERTNFAQFTPDSQEVVFIAFGTSLKTGLALGASSTRIERWSVIEHARTKTTPISSADC